MNTMMAQNTTVSVNVGAVLDLENPVANMWLSCINMALSDFYVTHSHYQTRLVLHTRDSMEILLVQLQQANFVIDLGEKAQIPIISYSASSPSLTSIRSPYFFRATQNDSTQVNAISAIVQAFGWREAVPIYVDNEYGKGVIPYLTDALQAIDTRIPYRCVISPAATDDEIVEELYKLMTMQTRVFIVHMSPSLGSRFFIKASEVGMMNEGYVWIMTDGMTSSITPQVMIQCKEYWVGFNSVPKGWEIPTNGNKLRIGVPVKDGFSEFVKGLGFDESKLKVYNSTEECDELFSKGSGNGGIAAAFDEVPYTKLFLAQYCSKYTLVEPTFKTDGFGFAFPKGSPLVPDVSRAILNVTEGDKMKEIEQEWFGKQSNCPDPSSSVSSSSLSLQSFWGLFLIAGAASVSALLIFTARI
ncbi:hypothetical protein GH714_008239 [Hevea brasiliensis]|uniref:Ionotropic glutamate receptor C-terminal domain-containing protein n=1 Tax=Hevea brasiliensis TaxID=3981 RepID=A0A6A6LWG5_HEVBR|nr:hypothetical protein GH714_008239 [Hevea brasiliensis]